ncbi:putative leucine-rich repeat receptor-like protein kinase, partial [Planoprotostelium fungivorum]
MRLTLSHWVVLLALCQCCVGLDIDVLRDLYNSTNGDFWRNNTNWNTSDVCSFNGVICNLDGYVTQIKLPHNNLTGVLSSRLGDLSNLTNLDLSTNNITGPIPSTWSQLFQLKSLMLNDNQLIGSFSCEFQRLSYDPFLIPSQFYSVTCIKYKPYPYGGIGERVLASHTVHPWDLLILSRFTGHIPSYIFTIPSLTTLDLRQNILDGPLPPNYNSNNITTLRLDDNKLTGNIPLSYSTMTQLMFFTMSSNRLGGNLAGIFDNMTNLIQLDVGMNFFNGSIPDAFYHFTRIAVMRFTGNQFTGNIPRSIMSRATLQDFRINRNRMSGQLSPDITGMKNLVLFWIYGNQFSGQIPYEIGNMTTLQYLMVMQNKFTGVIPYTLGRLINLKLLYLSGRSYGFPPKLIRLDNKFTGVIPPDLGNLTNLTDLILSQNYNLVGGVPRTFQNLGKIQTLNVNNCPKLGGDLYFLDNLTTVVQFQGGFSNFTGQIPASVGQMSHLSIFNAMGNQLTGSIPDFHPLANISTIGLFENNLTGLIPANFGVDLRNLDVSSNQLGGYLRREWTRYKNLTVLKLNDNNIGSAGPNYYDNNLAILQSLQKLKMFDVSNNPLGGELLIDAFDYLDNIEVLRLSV